eukprot:9486118-Pyramimonas_sp.AAC.2
MGWAGRLGGQIVKPSTYTCRSCRQCPFLRHQLEGISQAALARGGQAPRRAAQRLGPDAAPAEDVPAGSCDRTHARAARVPGTS